MNRLRTAATVGVVVMLAVGYAASQFAVFRGTAPAWAGLADHPTVRVAANVVLVLCAVLFLIRDRGEEADRL